MTKEKVKALTNLFGEFNQISLSDFRDAFSPLVRDSDPLVDRLLADTLVDFFGNRVLRANVAAALAEREDEGYVDDFALVIEKETDVGLCKECITGLIRIGTQEAILKLNYLAKTKPNATIASLLRRELEKLNQQQPVDYYLEHLAYGNKNARACRNSSRVLINIGAAQVVDEILAKFQQYDDLARQESSKVVGQLAEPEHLESMLEYIEIYHGQFVENARFLQGIESFDKTPKEERIQMIVSRIHELVQPYQKDALEAMLAKVEQMDFPAAKDKIPDVLQGECRIGLDYYLELLLLIHENKFAHAGKIHEEAVRSARVKHSRLRYLLADMGYGVGKACGRGQVESGLRDRTVQWVKKLLSGKDQDIIKMCLYGSAYFVQAEDEDLLSVIRGCNHIEGMSRLIESLGRRNDHRFVDFFLDLAISHQIVDMQDLAMKPLRNMPEVHPRLRAMLDEERSDRKKTAIRIIGQIGAREFEKELVAHLEGHSDIIRIEAITALGRLRDPGMLSLINKVMYDARSPVLIETCLEAIATIGSDDGVKLLFEFTQKSRSRKHTIQAVHLIVDNFRSFKHALPAEFEELVCETVKSFGEDREEAVRYETYEIASSVVSWNLALYEKLKGLLKESASRLRLQTNWSKEELATIEQAVRVSNRNYFYLKDMFAYHDELLNRARNHAHANSDTRMTVYEKVLTHLENNQQFLLNDEVETKLEEVILKGLELAGSSWRALAILFKIAGFCRSSQVRNELVSRISSVPLQAKSDLMDTLLKTGMEMKEIQGLNAIKNILVLEGSGFFRKRVVKYLSDKGIEVRGAESPDEAREMIAADKPQLIVSEIVVKTGYDGLDFLEELARAQSGIPLVLSTNIRDTVVLERAKNLNPKGILHKPYPMDKLDEFIEG